ncbi:MAG: DnaJ domain-containing protein [Deltaproteobacteria bacterium]|nr:DnaJ domain-containing protein [Deltaproteobacteria bacterium]
MRAGWDSDFYAALGLAPGADQESLRRAFLDLARRLHPDRNPGDRQAEEKFKLISQAYAVLSDPSSRARYDRLRRSRGRGPKAAQAAAGRRPSPEPARPQGTGTNGASTKGTGQHGDGTNGAGPRGAAPGERTANPDPVPTPGAAGVETPEKAGQGRAACRFGDEQSKTPRAGTFRGKALGLIRGLRSRLLSNPLAAKDDPPPWDIVFGLVLSPEAAASGTTIDIDYRRDDQPCHLSVRIPAGIAERTRLRLSGQGHLRSPGSRGDLLLDLTVEKK